MKLYLLFLLLFSLIILATAVEAFGIVKRHLVTRAQLYQVIERHLHE